MNFKHTPITNTNPGTSRVTRLWRAGRQGQKGWIGLFMCFFVLSLYGQNYQGAFHIEQQVFEESGDSLLLGFTFTLDSKLVAPCSAIIFEPRISDRKNHTMVFPYVQVNGETRAKLNSRWFTICSGKWLEQYQRPYMQVNIHKYTGEKLNYFFRVPYQEWMDEAKLTLQQEIIDCAGKVYQYSYTFDSSVKLMARQPYQVQPQVALVTPADEPKIRNLQGSAYLDFQSGRSVILPDFRRNPVELGKINDALTDVISNMDVQITGLFIEGYASPEGRYATNERLARERATALKNYISNRYMIEERMFTVRSTPEDWEGLKVMVEEATDLQQKEQVLRVINSEAEYDAKERQLKTLSVYNRLLKDFFPNLRRVEYQIDYAVRDYNSTEARDLIDKNPQNLSQAELYRVAESYGKESPEYKRIIMEIIPRYYSNHSVALNNAAALSLQNGEINTALRLLEQAQDIPAAWNNLGVAYLYSGELDKAARLFEKALAANIRQAEHNLAEVKKKREDEEKLSKRRK